MKIELNEKTKKIIHQVKMDSYNYFNDTLGSMMLSHMSDSDFANILIEIGAARIMDIRYAPKQK